MLPVSSAEVAGHVAGDEEDDKEYCIRIFKMEKENYYREWYSKMKADPERWKAYKATKKRWWNTVYSLPERKKRIVEMRRDSFKKWFGILRNDPEAYLAYLKKRREAAKRRREQKG